MLSKLFSGQKIEKPKELVNYIRLSRTNSIGSRTFRSLLDYYGSVETAIQNLPEFAKRSGKGDFKLYAESDALEEVEKMEKFGANYLIFQKKNYPSLLSHIPDPPPIISYKGNLDLLEKNAVAIVGSRNASLNGMKFTSKISSELSKEGICIISGLARGIDCEAHKAAFPTTIAVIAGGIDNIYPEENHKLQKQISEEALLIAEQPIGTAPLARSFPQRNRIIAGLSSACLVIEASLKSGSLITARLALEYNREVFACPGFPLDPRSKGTNSLIKNGANLFESSEDVVNFVRETSQAILTEQKTEFKSKAFAKNIDESLLNKYSREKIYSLLSSASISIDELHKHTDFPIPIIATILLELELDGKIVYHPNNRYSLNY
jgi:DNA processing protein